MNKINSTWYLQVLYLGTSYRNNNKLDATVLSFMLAYTQYSNNNSYQMWSVLHDNIIYLKIFQLIIFINIFTMDHRGDEIQTLFIFAHIYTYTWQDTHSHQLEHRDSSTQKSGKKVRCVNRPLSFSGYTCKSWTFHSNNLTPIHTWSTQPHMLNNRDASKHNYFTW